MAVSPQDAAAALKKEKCYGIAKAGKNDCAAEDGSHYCASYSKHDGYGKDWILLPEGTCKRIVGGSLIPTDAAGTFVKNESTSESTEKSAKE